MSKHQTQAEWEASEKKRMIANYLDHTTNPHSRYWIEQAMMNLPLDILIKYNPYAGNASDDCHTFS